MKLLIIGAGTIGLTYSWLLSASCDVSVLVRQESLPRHRCGYSFRIQDMRDHTVKTFPYTPHCVTAIDQQYDMILVMVNRIQLSGVLPALQGCSPTIVFMLNHWDIDREVSRYLSPEQYLYGFPSQVGGGREGNRIEAIVFDNGTVLGEKTGETTDRLLRAKQMFTRAGLSVEIKPDILSWLKVHYLQQSLSAGAILKAGGYAQFAEDDVAIKEMVCAFREGIAVCGAQGIPAEKISPANLFRLPTFFVARMMKGMFNKPETASMITWHMKQGLPEWIAGFEEVLHDGEALGVDMPVWKSYRPFIHAGKPV